MRASANPAAERPLNSAMEIVRLELSGFGDIGQYGMEGLRFWTKNKVVTQRWPDGGPHGENAFNIPTMG